MLPVTSSELHSTPLPSVTGMNDVEASTSSKESSSFSISHNAVADFDNAVGNDTNILHQNMYERIDKAPIFVNEGIINEENSLDCNAPSLLHCTTTNTSHNEQADNNAADKNETDKCEYPQRCKPEKGNDQANKGNKKIRSVSQNNHKHKSEHPLLLEGSTCDISLLSPALRLLHEVTYERIAHIPTISFSGKRTNEFTLMENAYPALSRMFNLLTLLRKRTLRANQIAANRAKEDERCAMLYEYAAEWKAKKDKTNAALLEKQHAAEMQECTFTPSITEVARRRCSSANTNHNYDANGNALNENMEKITSARSQQAFMERCLQWQETVQTKLKQRQQEEEREEAERIAKERATRLRRIRAWISHKSHTTPHLTWAENVLNDSDDVDTNNNRALFLPTAEATKITTPLEEEELADNSTNEENMVESTKSEKNTPTEEENQLQEQVEQRPEPEWNEEEEEEEQEYERYLYHEENAHVLITSRSERSAREYLHQLSCSANKAKHHTEMHSIRCKASPHSDSKDITANKAKARKVQMPTIKGGSAAATAITTTTNRYSHEPRRTLRQFLNDVADDKNKREMHVKELQEERSSEQNVVQLSDNMISPLFVPNALPAFRKEDGHVVPYDALDTCEKERARALLRRHHLEYLITRHELEQANRAHDKKHTGKENNTNDTNDFDVNSNNKDDANENNTNTKTNITTMTENRKLNKSQTLELVERLEAHQMAKEIRLQALQEHIQQQECSFQPKITHKSEILARRKNGNVPIYKRATMQSEHHYHPESKQHYHNVKEQNATLKEGQDLSFSNDSDFIDFNRSNVNRNNEWEDNYNKINHSTNSRNYRYNKHEHEENTRSERENNAYASQHVTEKINDMLARSSTWNERRLQRIRLARAEKEAAQLVECTFKPQRLQIHNGMRDYHTHHTKERENGKSNKVHDRGEHEQKYHDRSNRRFSLNNDDSNDGEYNEENKYCNILRPSHEQERDLHQNHRDGFCDINNNHTKRKDRHANSNSYMDEIAHVSPELSYDSTEMEFIPFSDYANNQHSRKGHSNQAEHKMVFKSPVAQVQRRQDALATAANIRVMQELEMLQNELAYHKDCVMREMSKERGNANQIATSHTHENTPRNNTKLTQNVYRDLSQNMEHTQEHDYNEHDDDDIVDEEDDMKYRIDHYINDDDSYGQDNNIVSKYYNSNNDMGVLNDEEDMWDELDAETDAIISMLEQKKKLLTHSPHVKEKYR